MRRRIDQLLTQAQLLKIQVRWPSARQIVLWEAVPVFWLLVDTTERESLLFELEWSEQLGQG